MEQSDQLGPLSIEEAALLRLFRTLDGTAREWIVARVLLTACGDAAQEPPSLSDDEREAIEEQILHLWPAGWPGREYVDLDYVGDPYFWLQDHQGEAWLRVLFTDANDEYWAAVLAEYYAEELINAGFPMPSDFGDDPNTGPTETDLATFQTDFVRFFQTWREQVLVEAEKRRQQCKDPAKPEGDDAPA